VTGHGLDVADDLLLDEVKAHGQQGDAEQQVQRAEPYAQLGVVALVHHPLGGHKVTKPDGGECYEAEIRRVRKLPVFPALEQERSHDYVTDHQKHAQPYGHGLDVVRVVVVEVVRFRVVVVVAVPGRPPGVLPVHGETQWRHDPRAGRHHFQTFACENHRDRRREKCENQK